MAGCGCFEVERTECGLVRDEVDARGRVQEHGQTFGCQGLVFDAGTEPDIGPWSF